MKHYETERSMAPNTPPQQTPLVEDETVAGGVDKQTGAPVIRPKRPDGKVDEATTPTDPREKRD